MREKVNVQWKWRETRDGDIGRARYKCFDLSIIDMDGDASEWSIKHGDVYIAMGMERDNDEAVAKVNEVLALLYRAVEWNDFVAAEQRRKIREEAGIESPR